MPRVRVAAAPRSYDAIIECGLLDRAGTELRSVLPEHARLFVITVPPVRNKWARKLTRSLSAADFATKFVEMPDGERHKRLSTIEVLGEKLVANGADRSSALIAFGGGVVGDVAGLLASLFMRGIDVIQIPTTVLAQVDAAIGGKTGVNLRRGKNLIGTFHQPRAVLIDPEVLSTLPDREFRAGLYESLKCGVIGNPALFEKLESAISNDLRRDTDTLQWVIAESVRLKAKIVSQDERESGLRRVLNFGHTIGHALEAESGYRKFLHGEAVAWGMVAAANIAAGVGSCEKQVSKRIIDAVCNLGPLPAVTATARSILRLIRSDKKAKAGKVHFVLPTKIGEVQITNAVPDSIISEAVNSVRRISRD